MKLQRKFLIPVVITAGLFLTGWALFLVSKSRTFQFFGGLTARADTTQKTVALTFDDAPSQYTGTILKTLADKNVRATFYAIGQQLEKYPVEARAIVTAGSELGNHSYSHQRMVLKSPGFIKDEITRTNNLIRAAGYTGEITFRPPNGKKLLLLPWYLNQEKMQTIMWDVEPDTYFSGSRDQLVRYTLEQVKPGSIILLHPFCKDACQADREALPLIIDGLRAKGYEFATVSQLTHIQRGTF